MFTFTVAARSGLLAATATTVLIIAAAHPIAASETQDSYFHHTRDCLDLFLSGSPEHATRCLPNTVTYAPVPTSSGGPNVVLIAAPAPIVAAPSPPVVAEPPPVAEEPPPALEEPLEPPPAPFDPCACGPCDAL